MYTVKDYNLADLYKVWSEDARLKYINRYASVDKPNQPFNGIVHSDKEYATLTKMSTLHSNQYDDILDSKAKTKWNFPQGGTFSQETLDKGVQSYYDPVDNLDDNLMDECIWTTYRVLDNMGYLTQIQPIIDDAVELYHAYKADHRSHAGFTGECDRRTPAIRKKAISESSDLYNMDYVIGGMRRKDGKDRNIYNDSLANYFRECRMYHRWFKWWESLPFDMHYSDYEIAGFIVMCKAKMAYAADFKAMDKHRTLKAHKHVDKAFATYTATPLKQLSAINMLTEELYYTSIIAGRHLYEGEHSLLSGIYPTHDSEGLENFSQLVTVITMMGFTLVPKPRKLKSNEVFIMVCGDDSFVLFGRELSVQEQKMLTQLHIKIAAAWGQIIEETKVDITKDVVTFCKKTFALRQDVKGFKHYSDAQQTPIHKYSLFKAIHQLRMPEQIPNFDKKSDLLIWMASQMDHAYGCADWVSVMQTLCQYNVQLITDSEVDDILNISPSLQMYLNDDWYWRNYVSFSLPNSPTIQFILKFKSSLKQ
jgi:hypothetical protein